MAACNDGTRAHYWLYETPSEHRETVQAVCRKCGAQREDPKTFDQSLDPKWVQKTLIAPPRK